MAPKEEYAKRITVNQDYDIENDTLFFYAIEDYEYKKSVRMDEKVILDFDKNNVPMAMEILHASKLFGVKPIFLTRTIDVDINIDVEETYIKLEATFVIQVWRQKEPKDVKVQAPNESNIPILEGMRLASA